MLGVELAVDYGIVAITTEKDNTVLLLAAPDGWTMDRMRALITVERLKEWKRLGFRGFMCISKLSDIPQSKVYKIPET